METMERNMSSEVVKWLQSSVLVHMEPLCAVLTYKKAKELEKWGKVPKNESLFNI